MEARSGEVGEAGSCSPPGFRNVGQCRKGRRAVCPSAFFAWTCASVGSRYFAASADAMLLSLHALSATLSFCGISFAA